MISSNRQGVLATSILLFFMWVSCSLAVFCGACGTENADDGKFCINCGRRLIVKGFEAAVATHRWPELRWKKYLFTKLRWGMTPNQLSHAINGLPLKRVDDYSAFAVRDNVVRYMFADEMDQRLARMDPKQAALIGSLNAVMLRSEYARLSGNAHSPTHFSMKYGIVDHDAISNQEVKVLDPWFRFVTIGDGNQNFAAVGFSSMPEDGKYLRKYMSSFLKNRMSDENRGIIEDTWADSDTLIKGRYDPDAKTYDVEIINWPAFDALGLNFQDKVNEYLESWHQQRSNPNQPCSSCNGTGRPKEPEMLPCTNCGGDGVNVEFGTRKRVNCKECRGYGKTEQYRRNCPVCAGSGKASN